MQAQEIEKKNEVESGRSLSVKGNLRAHIDFWKSGAHYPEHATAILSCHGVFTDQFIFRSNFR